MKKMMAIILSILMMLTLCACGKEAAPVAGGWNAADGASLTDEARAALDKALEGLVGVDYVPVALLASQTVSGTNYCILCEACVVYPDAQPYYALVYVCEDLQGKAEITKIANLDLGEIAESGEVRDAEPASEALMDGWYVDRESSVEAEGALLHLGSQVVAGRNHCVLCEGNELVFLYESLDGKIEVTQRAWIDVGALAE